MKSRLFILFVLLFIFVNNSFSQVFRGQEASKYVQNAEMVTFKEYSQVPNYFCYSANEARSEREVIDIVKGFLKNSNSDLQYKMVQNQGDGLQTVRYFQTVNGYPIEFTALNLQMKNNKVTEVNGEILDHPDITPNFIISEADALQAALNYVNATQYMWEVNSEFLPHGEKVIVPDQIYFDKSKLQCAYKFDIYALKPHNRLMIYVNAETGEVILDYPLIHFTSIPGTAITGHYGERQISIGQSSGQYILYDDSRGNGIHTYNSQNHAWYLPNATDYFNPTTHWADTPWGTDAHYATIQTYDYLLQKHNYNSINNAGFALNSFVNFNLVEYGYGNNINAFWNGQCMTYGNGNLPAITPLTTLDICAHEVTHGLTQFTSGLIYANESGALSEAFSDMMGCSVTDFAAPEYFSWTMGSMINYPIRNLQNPKELGDPDTYKGIYWDPNEEVHKNSTPLGHWFYLVVEGGSGINDFGNSFTVSPIGFEKASKIAFKTLTHYLTPSSGYADACFYSLRAAVDIFGACSEEVKSVGDGFYAIGVLEVPYENSAKADFSASVNESCSFPLTVQFTNKSFNCDNYVWDFGDGTPTSTQVNPMHTYNENGSFAVTLTGNSEICGSDSNTKLHYINISPDLACSFIMTQGIQNVTSCHAKIYDDGGPNGNYSNSQTSQLTVHSPDADSFILNFLEFDVEAGSSGCNYDYLSIHAGNSTASPLVGKYCNNVPPPSTLTIEGEYVTFYFYADPMVNGTGYAIELFCLNPTHPPIALFETDRTTSCNGIIHFTDISVGTSVTSWLWDFGDGATSTEQHPVQQYYTHEVYTLSLTAGNEIGNSTRTNYDYIVIENMYSLYDFEFEGKREEPFEIAIPETSENLKWYDSYEENLFEILPVFTGSTILHEPITEEKTYYIYDSYIGGEYKVGETANTSGGGFFTSVEVHYLIFDAYQSFELNSVLVNANAAGNRQIILRDAHQKVIWTLTVNLPIGSSRVVINKQVPAGLNLQLACASYPGLWRSDPSASVNYPYTIEEVMSIKMSSASTNPYGYYYYFYDWEIKLPDCSGELATVTLIPEEEEDKIPDHQWQKVTIYPNPTTGELRVKSEELRVDSDVEVYDIYGRKVLTSFTSQDANQISINISHLDAGIYFLKIDNHTFKVVKL